MRNNKRSADRVAVIQSERTNFGAFSLSETKDNNVAASRKVNLLKQNKDLRFPYVYELCRTRK